MTLPLDHLIETRMTELGIDRQALGFRLGYTNPLKAAGRVDALCSGHITSRKSQAALTRLPQALELPDEVVERALRETEEVLAADERQRAREQLLAQEEKDAEYRATFRPHAILQTERTIPSQIAICGFTGGAGRWLRIGLDISKPPITFVQQVLQALPERVHINQDGEGFVTFFGRVLGFVVNYSPDQAIRFNLDGQPLEVLSRAYRIGEVRLGIGGKRVTPAVMIRLLTRA